MREVCLFFYSFNELVNNPSTAYGSCQDALTKDPSAVDGLYYINNFGEV